MATSITKKSKLELETKERINFKELVDVYFFPRI